MYVCKTMQDMGYEVTLASDKFEPDKIEEMYGLGNVMRKCFWKPIPVFAPRLIRRGLAVRRMFHARKVVSMFRDSDADIVLSTQSSIFSIPHAKMYHFLYDIADLFRYGGPGALALAGDSAYWHLYYWMARRMRSIVLNPSPTWFFALSGKVLADLQMNGYDNSSLIYPPCQTMITPGPKKDYVLQIARIVPQKRLERFVELARRLPEYPFILAGLESPLHPGYKAKLLENQPSNLTVLETPIRKRPELMAEAKVYCYSGVEPGIGISFVEAIGAGCFPIAPSSGGGGEVLEAIHRGIKFETLDEGVEAVRSAMNGRPDPEDLRNSVKPFSPEIFMEKIRGLVG